MRKSMLRIIAMLLSMACFMTLTACGDDGKTEEKPVDGNALFQALMENVKFETELKEEGANAALYFTNLPDNAKVRFFTGNAYYADCMALITVENSHQRSDAIKSLYAYADQMTEHFRNYHPEQVTKCNNAVVWGEGQCAILCISADFETAKTVLRNAKEYASRYTGIPTETMDNSEPLQTESEETEPTQPAQTQPQKVDGEYPVLTSKSGELNDYGEGYLRVDNMAFMPYSFREESVGNYASIVNRAASELGSDIHVYSILIPTAIGIVLPDDIRAGMENYKDQKSNMDQVFGMLDDSITKVNIYNNLMMHRDEYLYFRTDFHWTGTGAYYAYEEFCKAKGITPYTLDQRACSVFNNFKGKLYVDDQVTADEIYAYHPYWADISMVFTDEHGVENVWDIIKDVSTWPESAKYNTFAGGDQPIAVYENPHVSEGVAIVIKESFGNALMPYLVDHYSVVYEIDYRYWEGNIGEFAREKGVNDVIFANNMGMVSTATLVAMLSDNF